MQMFYLILYLICFGALGVIVFIRRQSNKTTLRLTPWDEGISWLLWVALMINIISDILQVMKGG